MNTAISKHAGISGRVGSKATDIALRAVTTAEMATYAQAYTYAALAYSVMAVTWAMAEVAFAVQEGGRNRKK